MDEDDRSITAHTANLNAVTPRQSKHGSKASSPIDYLVRVRKYEEEKRTWIVLINRSLTLTQFNLIVEQQFAASN